MSRIGKKPIEIKAGVEVKVENNTVFVKGPKGEKTVEFKAPTVVEVTGNEIAVKREDDSKIGKSTQGLYRSLIAGAIKGVSEGYSKELELKGIGYRMEMQGNNLVMKLGYSHQIVIPAPEGITISVTDQTNVKIEGYDKQLVGEVAAVIRSKRKVEPYKGKGFRYIGEQVRRKAGKSAKA